MRIFRWLVSLTLVLVAVSALLACGPGVPDTAALPKLKSFEFMGCSGDPSEADGSPVAWRAEAAHGITYLLRHSDSCGYTQATAPQAQLNKGALALSYRVETPDGMLAACECEYWSKFSFGPEASSVRSVSLNGSPVRLLGSWPDGR